MLRVASCRVRDGFFLSIIFAKPNMSRQATGLSNCLAIPVLLFCSNFPEFFASGWLAGWAGAVGVLRFFLSPVISSGKKGCRSQSHCVLY